MKRLAFYFLAIFWACIYSSNAYAQNPKPDDFLQCVENEQRIICTLNIYNYIQTTKRILTNGWENTIQLDIELMNADKSKVLQRSRLEATQRCYIDPFNTPCLILWRGAKSWQRYNSEDKFIKAISHIGIHALTLKELPPDNYVVRISMQIMGSAQKRVESIRNWFKQANESKNYAFGSSTLIGAILGSKAEKTESIAQSIALETTPFYIDINHVPQEQTDIDIDDEPNEDYSIDE
ncbi:MAG: hypothetical protein KIG72_07545 [Bradymonadales bacterium]|nr:hypothetical protein [Bradymonadales bacterium]